MTLALITALAIIQQPPPPGIPVAPPPPPVAASLGMRAVIELGQACFDKRWESLRQRRFAAERLVFPKTSKIGDARWVAARDAVLAFIAAREALEECPQSLLSARVAGDADVVARNYRVEAMDGNIKQQISYEKILLMGLVDR